MWFLATSALVLASVGRAAFDPASDLTNQCKFLMCRSLVAPLYDNCDNLSSAPYDDCVKEQISKAGGSLKDFKTMMEDNCNTVKVDAFRFMLAQCVYRNGENVDDYLWDPKANENTDSAKNIQMSSTSPSVVGARTAFQQLSIESPMINWALLGKTDLIGCEYAGDQFNDITRTAYLGTPMQPATVYIRCVPTPDDPKKPNDPPPTSYDVRDVYIAMDELKANMRFKPEFFKVLGEQTKVERLYMINTGMTVPSPPQDDTWLYYIFQYTGLKKLALRGNALEMLHSDIGNLKELKDLILNNNKLVKLPVTIGDMESLESLQMENNRLNYLPTQITNLVNLTTLDVGKNMLVNLPEYMNNMESLVYLYLNGNGLTELPDSITMLKNLQELIVSENMIRHLPEDIGNLKNLELLAAEHNLLTRLPLNFGGADQLRQIRLQANHLADLPASITALNHCKKLLMEGNNLVDLPFNFHMKRLEVLDISNNNMKFMGRYPSDTNGFQQNDNLQELDLSGNSFEALPSMKEMEDLQKVDITNNRLLRCNPAIPKGEEWTTDGDFRTDIVELELCGTTTPSPTKKQEQLDNNCMKIVAMQMLRDVYFSCDTVNEESFPECVKTDLGSINAKQKFEADTKIKCDTLGVEVFKLTMGVCAVDAGYCPDYFWPEEGKDADTIKAPPGVISAATEASVHDMRMAFTNFMATTRGGITWQYGSQTLLGCLTIQRPEKDDYRVPMPTEVKFGHSTNFNGEVFVNCDEDFNVYAVTVKKNVPGKLEITDKFFQIMAETPTISVLTLRGLGLGPQMPFWLIGGKDLRNGYEVCEMLDLYMEQDTCEGVGKDLDPPAPCCKWDGTQCLSNIGRDICQDPVKANGMTALTFLDLGENEITRVPPQIGNFTYLEDLTLSNNMINGVKPEIGKCKNLTHLDLSYNKLKRLPENIGMLNKMAKMEIDHNLMTSLPDSLPKMGMLERLDASNNEIEMLPANIGDMPNLTTLMLEANNLQVLPTSLQYLTSLEDLELGSNDLNQLEGWIGKLGNLTTLKLQDQESGMSEVQPGIGNLRNLEVLYLQQNGLTDLPTNFCKMRQLEILQAYDNDLSMLPDCFEDLASMEELDLRMNNFESMPSFYKLVNMKSADITENKLLRCNPLLPSGRGMVWEAPGSGVMFQADKPDLAFCQKAPTVAPSSSESGAPSFSSVAGFVLPLLLLPWLQLAL